MSRPFRRRGRGESARIQPNLGPDERDVLVSLAETVPAAGGADSNGDAYATQRAVVTAVAELGLPLVRVSRQRRTLTDLFRASHAPPHGSEERT